MPENIFKILDGRTHFWQWDTKQKLIVLDDRVTKVRFTNKNMEHSVERPVYIGEGGHRVCNVPDVLLQLPKNLIAYACSTGDNGETAIIKIVRFAVAKSTLPVDYVCEQDCKDYTDSEIGEWVGAQPVDVQISDAIDVLRNYVGQIPNNAKALDVIGYIQERTSDILAENRIAITLPVSNWIDSDGLWTQRIIIDGVTVHSQVDLYPTAAQVLELQNDGVSLMIQNEDGVTIACSFNAKPTKTYTIQAGITEVTIA